MAVENNVGTGRQPGGITGRGFMPGQSGNPGSRPKGLARLAREAVGDGADLVEFWKLILRGDAKALGVRSVPLRDRMQAAACLADRGFGKPTPVVDLPEEAPQASLRDRIASWAERLPADVRAVVAETLDAEFEAKIEEDIAEVDEAARSLLPPPPVVLDRSR